MFFRMCDSVGHFLCLWWALKYVVCFPLARLSSSRCCYKARVCFIAFGVHSRWPYAFEKKRIKNINKSTFFVKCYMIAIAMEKNKRIVNCCKFYDFNLRIGIVYFATVFARAHFFNVSVKRKSKKKRETIKMVTAFAMLFTSFSSFLMFMIIYCFCWCFFLSIHRTCKNTSNFVPNSWIIGV